MIFAINYHAEPAKESPDHKEVAGALISCFVKAEDIHAALQKAEKSIVENLWTDVQFQDAMVVSEEAVEDDPEGIECYEQAEEEGESYVYHAYPIEED